MKALPSNPPMFTILVTQMNSRYETPTLLILILVTMMMMMMMMMMMALVAAKLLPCFYFIYFDTTNTTKSSMMGTPINKPGSIDISIFSNISTKKCLVHPLVILILMLYLDILDVTTRIITFSVVNPSKSSVGGSSNRYFHTFPNWGISDIPK